MKKFFEGLSLSSIVAGTLAAVTSFLLASKIGIAGSVMGAPASYIVSAVATKIYQNILTASGEKLQSASSSGNDDDTTDNKSDKAAESESDTTMTGMVNTVSTARKPREVVSNRANGRTYSVNELRKARSHNSKRTAIIVTLVSGLLAVAVTAGIVMLVTQGRGTDHIITPSTTPTQTDTKTQTDTSNQNNGLPQPGITDGSNDSNTKDSTSGSSNDGTDSSTSGSTGTDSSTDSNTNGSTDGSTGTDSSTNSGTTGGSTGSGPPPGPS